MGKKTNAASSKPAASAKEQPLTPDQSKQKTPRKGKSTLTQKAVKTVAAVALSIGGAVASKRKRTTAAKKSSDSGSIPAAAVRPAFTAYTHADIALRAYFISEARRATGLPADPNQDWLEAERELAGAPHRQSV